MGIQTEIYDRVHELSVVYAVHRGLKCAGLGVSFAQDTHALLADGVAKH